MPFPHHGYLLKVLRKNKLALAVLESEAHRHAELTTHIDALCMGKRFFETVLKPILRIREFFAPTSHLPKLLKNWNNSDDFTNGVDAAVRWGLGVIYCNQPPLASLHTKLRPEVHAMLTRCQEAHRTTQGNLMALTYEKDLDNNSVEPGRANLFGDEENSDAPGSKEDRQQHADYLPFVEDAHSCSNLILLQGIADERPFFEPEAMWSTSQDTRLFEDMEFKIQAVAYTAVEIRNDGDCETNPGKELNEKKDEEDEFSPGLHNRRAHQMATLAAHIEDIEKFDSKWTNEDILPKGEVLVEKHLIELAATLNFQDGLTSDFRISRWEQGQVHDDLFGSYQEKLKDHNEDHEGHDSDQGDTEKTRTE